MGVIFFASSLSRPLPDRMSGFPDWISHPGAYATLAYLACRAATGVGRLDRSRALRVVCAATLYGATDEIHQIFIPARDASLMDVVKDLIGAILGAAFYGSVGWRLEPRPRAASANR